MSQQRLRFSSDDDLAPLREVVAQNPLMHNERWLLVQDNVEKATRKKFLLRTLKDHLQLMVDLWNKKKQADKVRSGTEEVYSERDTLLQEISDLCREFDLSVKKKKKQTMHLGRAARDFHAKNFMNVKSSAAVLQLAVEDDHTYSAANVKFCPEDAAIEGVNTSMEVTPLAVTSVEPSPLAELSVEPSPLAEPFVETTEITICSTPSSAKPGEVKSTPPATSSQVAGPSWRRMNKCRTLRKNALDCLRQKEERANQMKMRELELEDRRLKVEEKKIQMEEKRLEIELKEREQKAIHEKERMKLELEERQHIRQLLASQQKIIDGLLIHFQL